MEKKEERIYSIPINNSNRKDNETVIYRHPLAVGKELFKPDREIKTLHDSYLKSLNNPQNDFLGYREKDADGQLKKKFTFFSYKKVFELAEEFGSGLMNLNLVPTNTDVDNLHLKFVGFYSKSNFNFFVSDIGCCLYDYTIIPIYDTLGEKANDYIFNQTKLETLLINSERMDSFIKSILENEYCKYIKNLIVLDNELWKDEWVEKTKGRLNVYKWEFIRNNGRRNVQPWTKVTPDSIYAFSYTSGTTGYPKGAMISHENMGYLFEAIDNRCNFTLDDGYLSYLPMAHILERNVFNGLRHFGCKIGIYSGKREVLFEDIKLFKPTIFVSVPRVYNKIYTTIMAKFQEKNFLIRKLLEKGLEAKLKNLKESHQLTHWFYDRILFNKIKDFFGGKVKLFITGGAPINADIFDFFKVAFQANFMEAYGQTEGCGAELASYVDDIRSGHVGGPLIYNELKLVDVPDMKYTNLDKDENGEPRPRGEIWVRGPNVIKGYYKLTEKTKETFVDGWLISGDIGQIVGKNNRIEIIDRKKNIFKLSQGEYIAPEKLEIAYRKANPMISNIFVHGNSYQNYLICIVNIEVGCLEKVRDQLEIEKKNTEEENKDLIGEKFLKLFKGLAKVNGFNRLEEIRKIIVVSEDWVEMGFVTVSLKNKRHDIFVHFKDRLNKLYEK